MCTERSFSARRTQCARAHACVSLCLSCACACAWNVLPPPPSPPHSLSCSLLLLIFVPACERYTQRANVHATVRAAMPVDVCWLRARVRVRMRMCFIVGGLAGCFGRCFLKDIGTVPTTLPVQPGQPCPVSQLLLAGEVEQRVHLGGWCQRCARWQPPKFYWWDDSEGRTQQYRLPDTASVSLYLSLSLCDIDR